MEKVKFRNGLEMPLVGYGVYKIDNHDECVRCVKDALSVGYRLIDTAQLYVNEAAVGQAIKESQIPREELFITTKVWPTNAGYEKAKQSILESLEKLQLDYVDCIMIHQPFGDYYGTYRAMVELYKQGKIKSLGLSNFYPDRLLDLIHYQPVIPVINQIEAHVFAQRLDEKAIMDQHQIVMQAWSPLARANELLFKNETLLNIAQKHQKSVAQIALKYLIQQGISVLPKSTNLERMKENLDLFDFNLDEQDLNQIKQLDGQFRFTNHYDPDAVKYIINRKY